MYLCAIIYLHTRYEVNRGINNDMTAEWCCQLIEVSIEMHGKPEIITPDQGSQFTSLEYIELLSGREKKISKDGKCRAIDNIFIERLRKSLKHEFNYLNAFEDVIQLYKGIDDNFNFNNTECFQEALDYEASESLYKKAA